MRGRAKEGPLLGEISVAEFPKRLELAAQPGENGQDHQQGRGDCNDAKEGRSEMGRDGVEVGSLLGGPWVGNRTAERVEMAHDFAIFWSKGIGVRTEIDDDGPFPDPQLRQGSC